MVAMWALSAGAQSRAGAAKRAPAEPVPVVIASEQEGARSLAQDARTLYWVSSEGVMRADKSGGGARKLYDAEEVSDFAVQKDRLYWLERYAVKTAPSRGGEVSVVADERAQPGRLALDPAAAYWTEARPNGPALVSRRRLATQVGEILYPDAMPQHLVADGASLYFTDFDGNVVRIGKFGGPPEILATDRFAPGGRLAVDPRHIYWTNPSGELVQRVSREGGKALVLFRGGGVPSALALEPHSVLLSVNEPKAGRYRVVRIPKGGGKPREVLRAAGPISELLWDKGTLYWIEDGEGGRRVMKAQLR